MARISRQCVLGLSVLLGLLAVAARADDTSPLMKVVALLGDLKKQLEEDGVSETALYNEYSHWCDSEAAQSRTTIADLQTKVADLNSFLQEQQARRDQYGDELEEAATNLASKESDLKGATEMRDREHADFKEGFQALEDSINELSGALETMADSDNAAPAGASLVQVANTVRHALQRSPNVPLSDFEQQSLNSLFQQAAAAAGGGQNPGLATMATRSSTNVLAPDDNGYPSDQPMGFLQASSVSESAPAAVLEALQKIKSEQETNRDKSLTEEQNARNNFASLKASLEDAIKNFQTELTTKKGQQAQSEETSARSQAQLQYAGQSLMEGERYVQEVIGQCQQKAREWKERTKLRSDEVTAVSEAMKMMTGEAAQQMNQIDPRQQQPGMMMMFLQTGMRANMKRNLDIGGSIRNILQSAGSPVLALLASRVQARMAVGQAMGAPDPFADVRKMVQEMIEKLMAEAAEEAEHKEFCDREMGKSQEQKTLKEKEIAKLGSQIEEMEATVAELADELEQLSRSMAEMEAMTTEATQIREKEQQASLLQVKQYQDAQALIGSAITVLQEFYNKHDSLVQTGASYVAAAAPPPETWDQSGLPAANDGTSTASGILGLLEIAQSDFAHLESEASTAEAMAEREYASLTNENQLRKASAAKQVDFKSDEKTKLEGSLQRAKADLEGFTKELDAVNEYIAKLVPECSPKVDSYEERKARREQEIESLKQALAVLNGDA